MAIWRSLTILIKIFELKAFMTIADELYKTSKI